MHLATAPILLQASRISAGLRMRLALGLDGGTTVRVLSVHRLVVNLALPDGTLVTVAHEAVGGLPNGILVMSADALDFSSSGIRPGMTARWIGGALRIPASLVVACDGAVDWSPRLVPADPAALVEWPSRSRLAREIADRTRVPGGLPDLPMADAALADLHDAIRAGDRSIAADRRTAAGAARRLIGLGPGLTPSGDDALAGIESALHVAGHPMAGFLAAALADVDERTTTVAAAMLRHAARGDAAERVHRLLDGLLGPDVAAIAPAIAAATRWGATSGSDLLAGVLLGLDAATGTAAATPLGTSQRVAA